MKTSYGLIGAGVAWLTVTLLGTAAMLNYSSVPGGEGPAPTEWPAASQVPHVEGRSTLVMFVHPHCPCSLASVGELARLMAHRPTNVEVRVLFLDPEGLGADWSHTDLWREAAAIPGVTVARDSAGREAQSFRAETSGTALLYDGAGRLLFQGGITVARGHAGDNPGLSSLESILLQAPALTSATPVFGCELFAKTPASAVSGK